MNVNEMRVKFSYQQLIFRDPMPTIQWDKDLQYIFNNDSDSSRFHILENGTLHIVEIHLDDEGAYGCTIGSSAGLKREEIRLIVKGNLH